MDNRRLALRLADEMRRLASECVEGTAPKLIVGSFNRDGESCALGWALRRTAPGYAPMETALRLQKWLNRPGKYVPVPVNASIAMLEANNNTPESDRHFAVVFPLLWLADEIEERASVAP